MWQSWEYKFRNLSLLFQNKQWTETSRNKLTEANSFKNYNQFTPSHNISPRFILILSSHLLRGLTSGLFPSDLKAKISYAFLIPSMRPKVPRPSHPPWFDYRNNSRWSIQVTKLVMRSSPASYHLPVRYKYSPQHPVLKYAQSMIFYPVSKLHRTGGRPSAVKVCQWGYYLLYVFM